MPMVQIDLHRDVFREKGDALSQAIHQGLIDGLDMQADDLFQIFRPHDDGELVFSPTFGGADRRDLVLLRITMVHMFPVDAKQKMYRCVVSELEKAGLRHDDILICVVEVGFEDWYAGSQIDA